MNKKLMDDFKDYLRMKLPRHEADKQILLIIRQHYESKLKKNEKRDFILISQR